MQNPPTTCPRGIPKGCYYCGVQCGHCKHHHDLTPPNNGSLMDGLCCNAYAPHTHVLTCACVANGFKYNRTKRKVPRFISGVVAY